MNRFSASTILTDIFRASTESEEDAIIKKLPSRVLVTEKNGHIMTVMPETEEAHNMESKSEKDGN